MDTFFPVIHMAHSPFQASVQCQILRKSFPLFPTTNKQTNKASSYSLCLGFVCFSSWNSTSHSQSISFVVFYVSQSLECKFHDERNISPQHAEQCLVCRRFPNYLWAYRKVETQGIFIWMWLKCSFAPLSKCILSICPQKFSGQHTEVQEDDRWSFFCFQNPWRIYPFCIHQWAPDRFFSPSLYSPISKLIPGLSTSPRYFSQISLFMSLSM